MHRMISFFARRVQDFRARVAVEADIKVLMAEDLESAREHLKGVLAETSGVKLRFVQQDAALAILSAASWRPEVVILELRLRGADTPGLVQALKKEWPEMAVVISALFFEPCQRQAYLRNGADFFFDKSLEWTELIAFLRRRMALPVSNPVDASRMTPLQVSPI